MLRTAYDITDYNSFIRNYMRKNMNIHDCQVCGMADYLKPMAFRNMPWCSENHRKQIQGDEKTKKF